MRRSGSKSNSIKSKPTHITKIIGGKVMNERSSLSANYADALSKAASIDNNKPYCFPSATAHTSETNELTTHTCDARRRVCHKLECFVQTRTAWSRMLNGSFKRAPGRCQNLTEATGGNTWQRHQFTLSTGIIDCRRLPPQNRDPPERRHRVPLEKRTNLFGLFGPNF